MKDFLRIALIQTTLDSGLAWSRGTPYFPEMNPEEGERIWAETCNALNAISVQPDSEKPHMIILPEFGAALNHYTELRNYARLLGAIIISGLDFQKNGSDVTNEAIVFIPYNWPHDKGNCDATVFHFGKRFPAWREKQLIEENEDNSKSGLSFKPSSIIYILDLGSYGKMGLTICADFYDLDRYLVYQGRVQHLILIAYNQDTESFSHLAESFARMVYCNVVICNTGYHGGSMAFSPKKERFQRIIYSHYGQRLHTVQTVELPVKSLVDAQSSYTGAIYKSPPPGYPIKPNRNEKIMLKITAKIRPDSDEVKVGRLVVLVDDGNETCEIPTDVHCEPREMLLFHMPLTMHIIKHLYSIAEDFHRRNLPYVSDIIVRRFHKTYNPQFNAESVEPFKMDSNIAEVLIITV